MAKGRILSQFYRITNISDQRVQMLIETLDGEQYVDWLEIDEVVCGVNHHACEQLLIYERIGLLRIEKSDQDNLQSHWLLDGF